MDEENKTVDTHNDIQGEGDRAVEEKYVISTRNLIPSARHGKVPNNEDRKKYAKEFLEKRKAYLKPKKKKKEI